VNEYKDFVAGDRIIGTSYDYYQKKGYIEEFPANPTSTRVLVKLDSGERMWALKKSITFYPHDEPNLVRNGADGETDNPPQNISIEAPEAEEHSTHGGSDEDPCGERSSGSDSDSTSSGPESETGENA
jgi:hypothetical protein